MKNLDRNRRVNLTRSLSCRCTAIWLRSRRRLSARKRMMGAAIQTSISRLSPAWLSTILAPVSLDEFLADHWLKQHLFCRGPAERFSELLSWSALNEILA